MGIRQWPSWAAKFARDLAKWIWSAPIVIALAAALLVVSSVVILAAACLERQFRLSGMVLQLLGVLVVAVGLRDTRRAFSDLPTTWKSIKQFWARRPRFGPHNRIVGASGIVVGSSSISARGTVRPGPNATLEERIRKLQEQYERLFDEVGALTNETRSKYKELTTALKTERNERTSADLRNRDQLKKAVAEGIPLEVIGVVFFLLGITAATASPEIASWFGSGACN